MRSLLAIVVTVAQVAGPWLCCCGPVRAFVAAPVATTPAASQDEAVEPVCPHCAKQAENNPADADKDRAPAKPGLPGRCPCCAVKLLDAVAVPPTQDAAAAVAELGLLPPVLAILAPVADVPATPAAVGALPGVSDLPFLTAEARLHAHHALRC